MKQTTGRWLYILAGSCLAAGSAMPNLLLRAFTNGFSTQTLLIGLLSMFILGAVSAAILTLAPRIVQQWCLLSIFLVVMSYVVETEISSSDNSRLFNAGIAITGVIAATLWTWKLKERFWPHLQRLMIVISLSIGLSPWAQAAIQSSPENERITFSLDKIIAPQHRDNVLLLLLDETSPEYIDRITQPLRDQGLHINTRVVTTSGRDTINAVPSMLTTDRHDDVNPCTPDTLCGKPRLNFSTLKAERADTDVLGFHLPYCRIQGLRSCYQARLDKNAEDSGYLAWALYRLQTPTTRPPFLELREKIKDKIQTATFWEKGGILFVHIPLPHLPAAKEFDARAQAYLANIADAQALVGQLATRLRVQFGSNFTLIILTDHAFRKPAHCADQDTDPTECITYRGLPPNRNRVALVTASPQVNAGLPLQTNLGLFAPGNTQP